MIFTFLLACTGTPEEAPVAAETIDDPRAYIVAGWAQDDSNWLGVSWINPTDAALVNPILDKELARAPYKGNAPTDKKKLDRFIKQSKMYYAGGILKSDEGRAAIERKIRERFEHPEVRREGKMAIADLGWVPGKLVPGIRGGLRIETDESLLDRHELARDHVLRALTQLIKDEPQALGWQLEIKLYHHTERKMLSYRFLTGRDFLYVRKGNTGFMTKQSIQGVEGLLTGAFPTHTFDLANADAEWNMLKPR